jgi:predicted PurR-regulated permease PerM
VERSVFRGLLLFGATVLAVWAFWQILEPFIAPIAWALCIAAVTARPYRFLETRLKRPRLASGLMVLLTAVVILAPLFTVSALVLEEARQIDFAPTKENLARSVPNVVAWLNETLDRFGLGSLNAVLDTVESELPDLASQVFSAPVAKGAVSVLLAPFIFLFGLLITLVTLYFVYREAPRIRSFVVELSPLDEADTDSILHTLRRTTSAAILGGVLVAIIQGALGGIGFAIAGIQSPVLWAVVMMAFSLLPFGGTALVWVPAGVYLVLTGDGVSGWFVLIWGVVIVGMSDNFLRPMLLVKTGAGDIHPMMLFFAIISGMGLFGVSGIVFGPLLLALLTTVVRIYRDHRAGASDPGAAPQPAKT